MKLAQGIITLTITFFLGLASMGSILRNLIMQNAPLEQTAHASLGIAIVLLVGAALSFQLPLAAFITFIVATLVSIIAMMNAATQTIGYIVIFSFVFTLFSLATWLVDRRKK